MLAHLDDPPPQTIVDPLCFLVRGWLWIGAEQAEIAAVEAWAGDVLVGSTRALHLRPDVVAAHRLPVETRTGFEIFAHHPAAAPGTPLSVTVSARLHDGRRTAPAATQTVRTAGRDFRKNHFGLLLDRETIAIQRRPNIFVTGPSLATGSTDLLDLIFRYLGPPPQRVLDVGCGLGYYGRELSARGHEWMGVEVKDSDCAELARLGLPHRQVEPGTPLPFADGAFDAALCTEVLEHIDEPRAFLAEVRRVCPRQLIVSVPNCELLAYLSDHLATPWHMLEADHKNFFTRWSLGSLLREFYPEVELRFFGPYPLKTAEGTPLHYNIFAVATA